MGYAVLTSDPLVTQLIAFGALAIIASMVTRGN